MGFCARVYERMGQSPRGTKRFILSGLMNDLAFLSFLFYIFFRFSNFYSN